MIAFKRDLQKKSGQALAEMIVVMAVLVPVLMWMLTLFQLQNVERDATTVARLSAWHNTLYTEDVNGTGVGLSTADYQARLNQNVITNVFDKNGVKDALCASNECIGDYRDFGAHINSNRPQADIDDPDEDGFRTDQDRDDGIINFTAQIKYKNRTLITPTEYYPSNRTSIISSLAGLASSDIGGVSISIPINPELSILKVVHPGGGHTEADESYIQSRLDPDPGSLKWPNDPVAGEKRYHVFATAALITNGFKPSNEAQFHEDIQQISSDGNPMTYFEVARGALSFFGFDEIGFAMGPNGLNTVPVNQSRLLPPQLGTFEE